MAIEVNGNLFKCQDGKVNTIHFKDNGYWYSKKIICPNFLHFKEAIENENCQEFCNFNGICIKGRCECFGEYAKNEYCRDSDDI